MDRIVIFVLCLHVCFAKITIKHLEVPSSVSVDQNEVILDCDFDPEGEVVDELKWYRNDDSNVVYQWLPQSNPKPTVPPSLKDNIDISYKASNDNRTMYRAVHFVSLSPELSGDYSCKVSGIYSEDRKTKKMIIYDPADSDLDLNVTESYSESNSSAEASLVAIFCNAEGLHPTPDLTISVSNNNETEIKSLYENEVVDIDEAGLYNISTVFVYDADDLPKSFDYTCVLTIPGTDYQLNETREYTLENASIRQSPSPNLLSTVLIIAVLGSLHYL